MFFRSKHCFFDKFPEKFWPADWKAFVQPPERILRSFFSSKSSFGHIECKSHKVAKRMRKTPKIFASMSKSDETFASNKNSFSAKWSLGQLECSLNKSSSNFSQSKWDVFCSRPESEKKIVYFVEFIFSFKKSAGTGEGSFHSLAKRFVPESWSFLHNVQMWLKRFKFFKKNVSPQKKPLATYKSVLTTLGLNFCLKHEIFLLNAQKW